VGRGTEPPTVQRYLHRADLFVAADVAAAAYFGSAAAAVTRVASAQRAAVGSDNPDETDHGRVSGSWPRAVLTHGASGMTVIAGGRVSEFDAFDVDVVDATGAGDAFVAGLIDQWLVAETDTANGVTFAAAMAAINCTARFTQPGLPDRASIEAFLRECSETRR